MLLPLQLLRNNTLLTHTELLGSTILLHTLTFNHIRISILKGSTDDGLNIISIKSVGNLCYVCTLTITLISVCPVITNIGDIDIRRRSASKTTCTHIIKNVVSFYYLSQRYPHFKIIRLKLEYHHPFSSSNCRIWDIRRY